MRDKLYRKKKSENMKEGGGDYLEKGPTGEGKRNHHSSLPCNNGLFPGKESDRKRTVDL